MNRWTRTMGALGGALALGGCVLPLTVNIDDGDGRRIRGNGHVVTEWRAVGEFDAVSASGGIRVVVERTGAEDVTITAEENLLRYLNAEVRGRVLYIGPRSGVNLDPRRDIVYRVESYEVVELEASGAVSMEAEVGLVDELWVSMSGASYLTVYGEANRQTVTLSGASRYDALDLWTRWTGITVSGASNAYVSVRERLDAEASGASHVFFRGDPWVNARVSGASSVTRY